MGLNIYLTVITVLMALALLRLLWLVRCVRRQLKRARNFVIRSPACQPNPSAWRADQTTIAWLGHATLLINLRGKQILTDPVFSEVVGPHLPWGTQIGPRRLVHCPLQPEQLPPLDLIVQSHAHMDHLDTASWKRLPVGPAVVMAAQNQRYIRRLGFGPITEMQWGQSATVAGVQTTAVEVNHWGERFPWSRDHGYNAYLLERQGVTILFGGDTAYTQSFRRACVGRKIQVAILPIGGYQPYIRSHASPEQAWQMFLELGAEYLIPIHHQTFILSAEPPAEPLQRLLAAAGPAADKIVIREVGATFVVPAGEGHSAAVQFPGLTGAPPVR